MRVGRNRVAVAKESVVEARLGMRREDVGDSSAAEGGGADRLEAERRCCRRRHRGDLARLTALW